MDQPPPLHPLDNVDPDLVSASVDWFNFEESLRNGNRLVPYDVGFVEAVVDDCLEATETLSKNSRLYRARMSPAEHSPYKTLSCDDMMVPPRSLAWAGRMSPEGLPCLYAALDPHTALTEVRPWPVRRLTSLRSLLTQT